MSIESRTLRPGLLVSLKTEVRGNINYSKEVIESEHVTETGAERASWNTVRTIYDPAEHVAAEKARSKASAVVRSVCAKSDFGLLCREADAEDLTRAIAEARRIANEFNATAKLSRISVNVITGRIAPDDVEAVKSINKEVSDLMTLMAEGISNLDVKVIRDAANKARSVGTMLPVETAARVQLAIDAARTAARQIVKAGEEAAAEIDHRAIRQITEARTAFLDLDGGTEIASPAAVARAIDLEPSREVAPVAAAARTLEME